MQVPVRVPARSCAETRPAGRARAVEREADPHRPPNAIRGRCSAARPARRALQRRLEVVRAPRCEARERDLEVPAVAFAPATLIRLVGEQLLPRYLCAVDAQQEEHSVTVCRAAAEGPAVRQEEALRDRDGRAHILGRNKTMPVRWEKDRNILYARVSYVRWKASVAIALFCAARMAHVANKRAQQAQQRESTKGMYSAHGTACQPQPTRGAILGCSNQPDGTMSPCLP